MFVIRRLLMSLVLALCLAGCSFPRIIVLNDPLDARQHNDLGVAYQQRSELDLALREYERAARLEPQWARPWINRGNVLAEQGQWRQAAKSYRQALRREAGNDEAMNNLAWVLLKTGKSDEALIWAEKAVAAKPQDPAYLDTLAEVQIACHDYAAARQTVTAALALVLPEELQQSLEYKLSLLEDLTPQPSTK